MQSGIFTVRERHDAQRRGGRTARTTDAPAATLRTRLAPGYERAKGMKIAGEE